MELKNEFWVPIVINGEETAYSVSNLARVKRVKKSRGTSCSVLIQKQNVQNKYFYVTLRVNGKSKTFSVHRLVCTAFHGPSNGLDVAHIDGSRTNNLPENLRWSTEKENMADSYRHGTACFGEKSPHSKLTSAQVCEIVKLAKSSVKRSQIAKDFGIHTSYVNALARGDWRRHDGSVEFVS